jgi:hypothetical protein
VDVAVRCSDDTGTPQPPRNFRFDAERRLRHDVYSISRRSRGKFLVIPRPQVGSPHTLWDGPPILTVRDN